MQSKTTDNPIYIRQQFLTPWYVSFQTLFYTAVCVCVCVYDF